MLADEFMIANIYLPAALSGLIQVLKISGYIRKEVIPIFAILLGAISGAVFFSSNGLSIGILKGVVAGLVSMGMYEGVDSVKKGD